MLQSGVASELAQAWEALISPSKSAVETRFDVLQLDHSPQNTIWVCNRLGDISCVVRYYDQICSEVHDAIEGMNLREMRKFVFLVSIFCCLQAIAANEDAVALEKIKERVNETVKGLKALDAQREAPRTRESRDISKALFDYKYSESQDALSILAKLLAAESNSISVSTVLRRIKMTEESLSLLLQFANESDSSYRSIALRRLSMAPLGLDIDTKVQDEITATFDRFLTDENQTGSELWLDATIANQRYFENLKQKPDSKTKPQSTHHIDEVVGGESSVPVSLSTPSLSGGNAAAIIYKHLEELRLLEARLRFEGALPLGGSRRVEIIKALASGTDLREIDFLPEEFGIRSIEGGTAEAVLFQIWENQVASSRIALIGLLRFDNAVAWGAVSEMLEGSAERRAHALEVLMRVRSPRSIATATALLSDESIPGVGPSVFHLNPVCNHAVQTLSHIVENGATEPLYIGDINPEHLELWRDWSEMAAAQKKLRGVYATEL
ncbi:MAG: hypothetical protein ACSHYA_12285 [Opitutaceae bacterium]